MTVTCYIRGHLSFWKDEKNWLYADTDKAITDDRPCPRCDRMATPEGHDACLGHIPNVKAACCGHGISEPYILALPMERVKC